MANEKLQPRTLVESAVLTANIMAHDFGRSATSDGHFVEQETLKRSGIQDTGLHDVQERISGLMIEDNLWSMCYGIRLRDKIQRQVRDVKCDGRDKNS